MQPCVSLSACALEQGPVAGLVLRPVRDMVPHDAGAVRWLLIDAYDAVTRALDKLHDLPPAVGVVPVFALRRALDGNADVRLGDGPGVVG